MEFPHNEDIEQIMRDQQTYWATIEQAGYKLSSQEYSKAIMNLTDEILTGIDSNLRTEIKHDLLKKDYVIERISSDTTLLYKKTIEAYEQLFPHPNERTITARMNKIIPVDNTLFLKLNQEYNNIISALTVFAEETQQVPLPVKTQYEATKTFFKTYTGYVEANMLGYREPMHLLIQMDGMLPHPETREKLISTLDDFKGPKKYMLQDLKDIHRRMLQVKGQRVFYESQPIKNSPEKPLKQAVLHRK